MPIAEITRIRMQDIESGLEFNVYPEGEKPCVTYRSEYDQDHTLKTWVTFKNNDTVARTVYLQVAVPGTSSTVYFYLYAGEEHTFGPFGLIYATFKDSATFKVWISGREAEAHSVTVPLMEGNFLRVGKFKAIRGQYLNTIFTVNLSPTPAIHYVEKGVAAYSNGTSVTLTAKDFPFGYNAFYWAYFPWGRPDLGITYPGLNVTTITITLDKNIEAHAVIMPGPYHPFMPWQDINLDGTVDIFDVVRIAAAYGIKEGEPGYDLLCDLNADGIIDIYDLVPVTGSFGYNAGEVLPRVSTFYEARVAVSQEVSAALTGAGAATAFMIMAETARKLMREVKK